MKRDLKIIYKDSTNKVKKGFGSIKNIQSLSGYSILIQNIVYYIYTEINSNKYNLDLGSKISNLNNLSWDRTNESIISALLTSSILQIEDKIKKIQTKESKLDASELLKKLEILSISYNDVDYKWDISVIVHNMLDQSFSIQI